MTCETGIGNHSAVDSRCLEAESSALLNIRAVGLSTVKKRCIMHKDIAKLHDIVASRSQDYISMKWCAERHAPKADVSLIETVIG